MHKAAESEAIRALEKVLTEKEAVIAQMEDECANLRRSIHLLGGQTKKPSSNYGKREAKKILIDLLTDVQKPLTPQDILRVARDRRLPIRHGSMYTTLRRAAADGELIHDPRWNTYAAPTANRETQEGT